MVMVPPPPLDVSITIAPVSRVTLPVIPKVPFVLVLIFPCKVVGPVMAMSLIFVVAPSIRLRDTVPVPESSVKSVAVPPLPP